MEARLSRKQKARLRDEEAASSCGSSVHLASGLKGTPSSQSAGVVLPEVASGDAGKTVCFSGRSASGGDEPEVTGPKVTMLGKYAPIMMPSNPDDVLAAANQGLYSDLEASALQLQSLEETSIHKDLAIERFSSECSQLELANSMLRSDMLRAMEQKELDAAEVCCLQTKLSEWQQEAKSEITAHKRTTIQRNLANTELEQMSSELALSEAHITHSELELQVERQKLKVSRIGFLHHERQSAFHQAESQKMAEHAIRSETAYEELKQHLARLSK